MNRQEQFHIVYRSLKQEKLRSFLSTLGVIFGVVSIVTMFSVGEGAKRKILRQIEQLGINNIILKTVNLTKAQALNAREHLSNGVNADDIRRIQSAIPLIDIAAPLKEVKASIIGISKELYPEVVAVSTEFHRVENMSVSAGRFLSDLDISNRNFVCIVGNELSQKLGPAGKIGAYLRIENEMFKIIGVLSPRTFDSQDNPVINIRDLNRLIIIPLSTVEYVEPGTVSQCYSEVKIRVPDKDNIFLVAQQINAILDKSHLSAEDYQVVIPLELLNKQKQTQGNLSIFLGSIAFISLLVGGIGIMNIMLANVSERTREIGIRRAIGANQEHIKSQFLLEAVFISLIGGFLGLVLALVIILLISILGKWETVVNLWIILFSISLAVIVGILSGLYPAVKASRMNPIQALRNE